MLSTLILKELRETLFTYRFTIAALLCLILIPLGMYVTVKDYNQRYSEYRDSMRLYQERTEGKIKYYFQAEGFRPPSPLSIFSLGLKHILPNKVKTSRNGEFKIEGRVFDEDPQSVLSGEVDFAFILSVVLSIMALTFTFNNISGEKESGSLRLVMSNPIPRWMIILAKVLGNYIAFLVPFFIGLLNALIILILVGGFPLFSQNVLLSTVSVLLISIIFIFVIFNLGILVSSRTNFSNTSMITVLLIWVILVLVVPKSSSMIAQLIYPIKSERVINIEKQIARKNLTDELDQRKKELLETIVTDKGLNPKEVDLFNSMDNPVFMEVLDQYDNYKISLENEYEVRINKIVGKIEQDYSNKRNTQEAIAMNLSRISPICCFINILTEISGTGSGEVANFNKYAQGFQHQVENEIYNNYVIRDYIL